MRSGLYGSRKSFVTTSVSTEHEPPRPAAAAGKTVFLTGGSGLLGTALLESIPRGGHVIALSHRSPIARAGVETLRGDVRQPLLGLSGPDYEALASRIDLIIHSASITRLISPARRSKSLA